MSTRAHTHFEEGNVPYVAGFEDKGKLAIPPAKHLAIGSSTRDVEVTPPCIEGSTQSTP